VHIECQSVLDINNQWVKKKTEYGKIIKFFLLTISTLYCAILNIVFFYIFHFVSYQDVSYCRQFNNLILQSLLESEF
jgi:hypothetical protein